MSVTSTATSRRTIQLPIDDGVVGLRGLSPQRHRFELEYEQRCRINTNDLTGPCTFHPPAVVATAAADVEHAAVL